MMLPNDGLQSKKFMREAQTGLTSPAIVPEGQPVGSKIFIENNCVPAERHVLCNPQSVSPEEGYIIKTGFYLHIVFYPHIVPPACPVGTGSLNMKNLSRHRTSCLPLK